MICELTAALCFIGALWTTEGVEGFVPEQPEFENVTISHQGIVTLAPELTEKASPDAASVWTLAQTRKGNLYFGTGNNGRVYLLEPGGKARPVFDAETGEILALCVDDLDNVYFGLTPDGTVFRIRPGAAPEELFATEQDYIFSLLPGPDGNLYCATGINGKLYRISRSGKGKLVFTAPQAHLTALAWLEPGKELLVGTTPDGIVYRLKFGHGQSQPEVSVLYDTPFDEIRALATVSRRSTREAQSVRRVYIAANPGENNNEDHSAPAVLCVQTDGILRWEWTCPESTVFDILMGTRYGIMSPSLLVATGTNGMVYELDSLGRHSILQRASQAQTICLVPGLDRTWIGTAGPAGILALDQALAQKGYILSDPHDCEGPARFSRIRTRAEIPAGTELEFDTRSGNSETPDSSWSEWQEAKGLIQSPVGRFVQWRARFSTDFPNLTPRLEKVDLYYQIPNRPPVVTKFEISSLTLEQAGQGNASPVRELTWEAEDPDQDSLLFQIHFKEEKETRWKPVAQDLTGSSHQLDTRTLPDGWYRFKLEASDRASRPTESARNSETVTLPCLIDNTPPQVTDMKLKGNRLSFSVRDRSSPIAGCRVAVNAGPWQPAEPTDLIFDSPEENFQVTIELEPDENTIAVWAADGQGNAATGSKLVSR